MIHEFPLQTAVAARYSVRTYDGRAVEPKLLEALLSYAEKLENPLGPSIGVQLIEHDPDEKGEKLGTYGVIKGARQYLAVTVNNEPYAAEALGYAFEQLVLYAAALGIGTCWLGGTFNKSAFAAKVTCRENEVFPILSPIGYPAKKRTYEQLFRRFLHADGRKPWEELFFLQDFGTPFSKETAGEYAFALEMLRQAPSATNRQPWRVVRTDQGYHFYEKHSLPHDGGTMDMQRIDLGIAICHFHLAALEKGFAGHFDRACPAPTPPRDTDHIISWLFD